MLDSMLTDQQLIERARLPESQLLERKERNPKASDLRKTLVAFANSVPEGEHAVLFIGITDDGKIKGVENTDDLQKEVNRTAEHDCYPAVKCTPKVIQIDGVNVVAVVFGHSKEKPHFTGHSFVRRGSESRKATQAQFEELIASRNDKAGKILAEKAKNKPISVEFTQPSAMKIPFNFMIEECNAHWVRFYQQEYSFLYSPSLDDVTIGWDISRHRFMLKVKGKQYDEHDMFHRLQPEKARPGR
jgi:hypothetical protein